MKKKAVLQECPFCHHRPEATWPWVNSFVDDSGLVRWMVSHTCLDEDLQELDVDIVAYGDTEEQAIERWNKQVCRKRRKPKKPDVDPADDYFGTICTCAVRYSLGRQTYMPTLVQSFILPLLPKMSEKTLAVMERDIRQARSYGDPSIDRPTWMKFLSEIRKVMDDRGIKPTQ